MVAWRNTDSVIHRVRFNDGSLDTQDILPGQTSTPRAMPTDGANYHCPYHPGMIGAINASGGAPPECDDPLYC
jgi:plastocyanin